MGTAGWKADEKQIRKILVRTQLIDDAKGAIRKECEPVSTKGSPLITVSDCPQWAPELRLGALFAVCYQRAVIGNDLFHDFLNMMGNKAGRVAFFGVPLQQQWS
jgi:hypothetical protein